MFKNLSKKLLHGLPFYGDLEHGELGKKSLAILLYAYFVFIGCKNQDACKFTADLLNIGQSTTRHWYKDYLEREELSLSRSGDHPKTQWLLTLPEAQRRAQEWLREMQNKYFADHPMLLGGLMRALTLPVSRLQSQYCQFQGIFRD